MPLEKWASRDDDGLTTSEEVGTTFFQDNIMVVVEMVIGIEVLVKLRVRVGNIEVFKLLFTVI